MNHSVGVDIGGTKCAVSVGCCGEEGIRIVAKESFPTTGRHWQDVLSEAERLIRSIGSDIPGFEIGKIGICCGGPLDSASGTVLSPPNLPGWDNVPVCAFFQERFGVPVRLQNDANACAWAEYLYGAGRGTRNMVFMTFGTGLGAGLVLDGKLYSGTNDNAGEIGHIRMAPDGPVGYNKAGSAEGFCSGAGIARLAQIRAKERNLDIGEPDTREIFAKVREGDPFFTAVFRESAEKLAMLLAITIDIINPEVITLGGVYMRNADLFMPVIRPILEREALPDALRACRIVPAGLGEKVGDYAALAVANME
ncbi:MAG: ROK family protein [Bacteroidales bacterium]|nr:ROK family protein [Bacteroidales bacterium]